VRARGADKRQRARNRLQPVRYGKIGDLLLGQQRGYGKAAAEVHAVDVLKQHLVGDAHEFVKERSGQAHAMRGHRRGHSVVMHGLRVDDHAVKVEENCVNVVHNGFR